MTVKCTFFSNIFDLSSSYRLDNAISDELRFLENFKTGSNLGSGAFAIVKKCSKIIDDGSEYAVKIVNKRKLSYREKDAIYDEIKILQSLNHPHILRLFHTYDEHKYIYLVTELIAGGELFDRVVSKGNYTEKETRDACKIMFEAVEHCHDNNVVHRDLKPENLLLMSLDNDSELKIADFGFAKYVKGDSLCTMCGTPNYMAPEMISRKYYGNKVDMWSLGCIIYALLCGYLPFDDDNRQTLGRMIRSGLYSFDGPIWSQVSDDAKDLVSKLLMKDPSKRFSAEEALSHRWLCENGDLLKARKLDKTLENLSEFNSKRKLPDGVRTVNRHFSGSLYYKIGRVHAI